MQFLMQRRSGLKWSGVVKREVVKNKTLILSLFRGQKWSEVVKRGSNEMI
jgi:hypothetical protein